MTRKYWALLALAAAEGKPLSPVQLQKSIFLLGKAFPTIDKDSFYDFTPYHYGPFDSAVYHDADELAVDGLAVVAPSSSGRWSEYRATPDGIEKAKDVAGIVPKEMVGYLTEVVGWARELSFRQLVKAVYEKFPEYRSNSVFQY